MKLIPLLMMLALMGGCYHGPSAFDRKAYDPNNYEAIQDNQGRILRVVPKGSENNNERIDGVDNTTPQNHRRAAAWSKRVVLSLGE